MKTGKRNDERDGFDAMLDRLRRPVITDRTEERRLIALAQQGDAEATRNLLGANCGLVLLIAKRYRGRGYEIEDLFMFGLKGLHDGIIRFDLAQDVRLTTYAAWRIRSRIQASTAVGGLNIRPPYRIYKEFRKLYKAEREISAARQRPATEREIARALGVTADEIKRIREDGRALSNLSHMVPFDEPAWINDSSREPETFGDRYLSPDAPAISPENLLIERLGVDRLRETMRKVLTPIEQAVIEETFFNERTLEATGTLVTRHTQKNRPVCRERVRQLQERALGKLRQALTDESPSDDTP